MDQRIIELQKALNQAAERGDISDAPSAIGRVRALTADWPDSALREALDFMIGWSISFILSQRQTFQAALQEMRQAQKGTLN